ncbi:MAG: hypothetical protein COT73_10195 [Bdellovibrio sp. CG10_big_fil_rev_8_21_14_0_10_47_8]|nr:MAG: hypothetical protein COT73_10195 [Bdellovibrio sp. CG10_big_fil_rev_8_21_14_0_10_47_8]
MVSLLAPVGGLSQSRKASRASSRPARVSKPAVKAKSTRTSRSTRKSTASSSSQRQLSEALSLVRSGQYAQAVSRLFPLSRRADLAAERMQIKYIMGVCLIELKIYQAAAFQFVDVIRNGNSRYTKQAIEKLSVAADELGDDSLLNYAISKIQLEDFPDKYKDMIYYRLGEVKMKGNQFGEAVRLFARVGSNSRYYSQAAFNRGRSLLELKRPEEALKVFKSLYASRSQLPVTDTNKVAAELAIARAHYQAQQWDDSIEWYRKIPRDTEFWHSALFEESWAYLRAAKFRSVLSNFQSLHSAYYEDYYIPESLLLRAIVYLYICKYDEMEKVLDLFERSYGSVRATLSSFIKNNRDAMSYFQEIEKVVIARRDGKDPSGLKIPFNAARSILDEGDIKRSFAYLRALTDEKRRIEAQPLLSRGSFARYANKIIANRTKNTRIAIGEMVKNHMYSMRAELKDLYEQAGFIRYEMINGQKELLKKKIAGKTISDEQIDEEVNRQFYVQNGYEYWPFEGEYWLDEIGNYQYLGKQSCE